MDEKKNDQREKLSRRDFLRVGAAGAVLGAVGASACAKKSGGDKTEAIVPRKKLGKTSMITSILAMGGGSALSMVKDDQEALALIDLARRKGVNYFDSGSDYDRGRSERRFGEALEPYRKEVHFSTKYLAQAGPDKLKEEFERSLKSFRTDYIDVANIHGLGKMQDVEDMFTSGTLEALVKLKEQGVVRYIGVTSHNHPPAMAEALKRFNFDTCLQAANASKTPFIYEFDELPDTSFEDLSLPIAVQQGIGIYAFKVTGQRRLIQKGAETDKAPGSELLRYALSLPVHGIVLGMHKTEHVVSACELAANFTPMTPDEMRSWNERLSPSANKLTLHYLNPDYVDNGGWRAHLA
jgi:uncharacterized protein